MPAHQLPSARRALLVCLSVAATAVLCGALVSVAALLPPPPAALFAIVLVCVACPIAVAYELPPAVASLRAARAARLTRRHLERLRRELERLPETEHPLGL